MPKIVKNRKKIGRKKKKGIKVEIACKSSLETSFRVFKALSILLDEKDVLLFFRKQLEKRRNQLKLKERGNEINNNYERRI